MENRTADQLLQDYTAMGHSVALITDVIAGNSMAEEDAPTRQSCVDRNVQHLELMRAKDDIDMIAERAARRALDLVLVEVGRSVVKKTLFIVGVVFIFALVMLKTGKPL
jgi:hypothetical protein